MLVLSLTVIILKVNTDPHYSRRENTIANQEIMHISTAEFILHNVIIPEKLVDLHIDIFMCKYSCVLSVFS